MRILEPRDIVQLLRTQVEKAGSQAAWAESHGIERANLNKVLHGARPPTESIIRALGLRTVVISDRG
jgi:hypothetical protein